MSHSTTTLIRNEDGFLFHASEADFLNAAADLLVEQRTHAAPQDNIAWEHEADVEGIDVEAPRHSWERPA